MPIKHKQPEYKQPEYKTVNEASYLLVDDIGFTLCAAWPLLPSAAFEDASITDAASFASRVARCSQQDAIVRLEFLLSSGILAWDGSVEPYMAERLRKAGHAFMFGAPEEQSGQIPAKDEDDLDLDDDEIEGLEDDYDED